MIGTRDWTVDGEGPFLGSFLDRGLDRGWVTKLWQWRAFFVYWRWWVGDVGTFGSLVCNIWEWDVLEPDRGQWVVEGGQERKWFRTMKG